MEKGEKASPTPSTQNIFDAASLLGASPFATGLSALPFGHLAHLPGAFSMLGHPAFPVSTLFGRLGDGLSSPLGSPGSLPTSLTSSSGSVDSALSPAIFTLGQAGSVSDPLVLLTSGQKAIEDSKLFSSPAFSKPSLSPPSKPSQNSSSSPPNKRPRTSSTEKPSSGVKEKLPGSRGRPRKLTKQPPIPLSLVSGTSILSPSQLEKYLKKRETSATNGHESKFQGKSPGSRASHNGLPDRAERKVSPKNRAGTLSPRENHKANMLSQLQDSVHIDSLKKKLIGDQIRQRMQNNAAASLSGSAKKRGRGRPPRISKDLSPKENEAEKNKQEALKQQLEAELKQQQMALRMLKKANSTHKELHDTKPNTSLQEKHDIFNKSNKTLSGTNQNLLIKTNTSQVDSEFRKATVSPKDVKQTSSRETSPLKSDRKSHQEAEVLNLSRQKSPEKVVSRETSPTKTDGKPAKHVGLLNLSRQRSPEEAVSRETSPVKSDRPPVKHVGLFNFSQKSTERGSGEPGLIKIPSIPSHQESSSVNKSGPVVASNKTAEYSSGGDSDSSESSSSGSSGSSSSESSDEEDSRSESGSATSKQQGNDSAEESSSSDSSGSSSSESSDEEDSRSESGSATSKQQGNDSAEGSGRIIKRRTVILDESHLRIPLQHGWKRQTNIHTYGRRGIVGEVWYFAPCGRKMKTIPDVMRYLERNCVTEFGRDNFSFNTKVNVGEFFENRAGGENGYVKLTTSEIDDRLAVTLSRRNKKIENQKKQEKIRLQQQMAKKLLEAKMKQKQQHQEMARKIAELQFKKRFEKQQQKEQLRRAKQMKILEKQKEKEQMRIMRERERLQREEEMRMKRDIRTQHILEKQREKEELAKQREYLKAKKAAESNLMWYQMEQERELQRKQAEMLKEQLRLKQEAERQRQHIMLLKALEQRKRLECRERQREEKINERRMSKEKKVEQRRMEFVLAQELKKLRDDMELKDSRPLPEFSRIRGCLLDGEAFADCLMSLEFLHNFAAALGFDADTLPTLKGLQDAVTSKTEEDGEEYLSLVSHLLRYALDDPGFPNPKEAVTRLGQKIADIEITDVVLPELLRVFMVARNGKEDELSESLKTLPLEAFSVAQRASVLAFLCNELNCSKNITTEIERSLDRMGDIRRDKWVVEGKLRRLRALHVKKFYMPSLRPVGDENSTVGDGEDSVSSAAMTSKQNSDEEENSGNESGKDESFNDSEADDPTTLEECEKQIEKLHKLQVKYRDKVFDGSHNVRAIILGQDRYKRTYWVLPRAGGVFVEGMESGEIDFNSMVKKQSNTDKKLNVNVKSEPGVIPGDDMVKNEVGKVEVKAENDVKCENDNVLHKNSEHCVKEEAGKDKESHDENAKFKDEGTKETVLYNNVDKVSNSDHLENSTSERNKKDLSVHSESASISNTQCSSIPNGESVDTSASQKRAVTHSDKMNPHSVSVSGNDTPAKCSSKNVELKIPSIKPCAINTHDSTNLFLHVPSSTKLSDFCNISSNTDSKTASSNLIMSSLTPTYLSSTHVPGHVISQTNQITSPPKPPPAHSSKNKCETKPSFMSIDSILMKKEDTSEVNQFFPPGVHALSPSTNTTHKDSPSTDGKPWFSILPRVPCDDMSLTRGQHQSFSAGMFTSPPYISSQMSSFRSFPVISPSFSSFQMGQILSTSVPGTPTSSGLSTPVNDPFKVPDIPNRSQSPDTDEFLKTFQGEAKPIPEEYQKGWWKISDVEELRQLQKCLHPRGVREKNLQKTLQKFSEYTTNSCSKGKKEIISLESSDSECEETKQKTQKKTKGKKKTKAEAKSPKDDKKAGDNDKTDDKECAEVKDKENKDKDNKDKDDKDKEDKDIGDKDNSETLENGVKTEDGEDKDKQQENDNELKVEGESKKKKAVVPVIDSNKKCHEADLQALEEVQNMEDRISSASLQSKGWKLDPKIGSEESKVKLIPRWQKPETEEEQYPLEVAKQRLLQMESRIERRYLKPPLSKQHRITFNSSVSSFNDADDKEEHVETVVPVGLQTWRNTIAKATSPAQLMLCIVQLNNSISWEKSIMKVLCQICRHDDNEAQLLLCDGCDRGYHTYCFKPKMESVPEGDWYCFECISKAVGESCCLVCGRRFGKMAECYSCPRAVHLDCLDPPLPRIPRKWFCASCEEARGCKRRPRKNSTTSTPSTPVTTSPRKNSTPSVPTPTPTSSSTPASSVRTSVPPSDLTPTGRKRRCDFGVPRKRKNKESEVESPEKKEENQNEPRKLQPEEESSDMVMCRLILMEMEKHEDGWPFLQPVNCKQFTSYRKFIKKPMDFSTMKQKLRDDSYKMRGEFAADAQLVFDNCKTFNEDESEVGHCGHTMRKFFDRRWKELLSTSSLDEETDEASPCS